MMGKEHCWGGNVYYYIFCLCVYMCVSIHDIHTRSLRDPNNVISVKGKGQPDILQCEPFSKF